MVNLCNSGTKDFVELWGIIHLNIWTQLTQSITVKPVQMSTSVKWLMLSLPKQIPIQSLHLTRPATTFFDSQMKKNLSKTITAKLYPVKEYEENNKEECIENKDLSDYIYPIANL